MAVRYTQEAQKQLNPAYTQQIQAVQSQIPAIKQLYDTLFQGVAGEQQMGEQNILEDASARGVLKSTIPVDNQMMLGQQMLAKRGALSAEQAQKIGGINQQVAGIRTEQANAVVELANSLWQRAFNDKELALQRSNYDRQYKLQKSAGDRQYQLDLQRARQGF